KQFLTRVRPARFCLYFITVKAAIGLTYFFTQKHPALFSQEGYAFFAVSTLAYVFDGLAWILYFEIITEGPISIMGTLLAAYPAFTILFARIFLKEILQPFQYAGIALV